MWDITQKSSGRACLPSRIVKGLLKEFTANRRIMMKYRNIVQINGDIRIVHGIANNDDIGVVHKVGPKSTSSSDKRDPMGVVSSSVAEAFEMLKLAAPSGRPFQGSHGNLCGDPTKRWAKSFLAVCLKLMMHHFWAQHGEKQRKNKQKMRIPRDDGHVNS